MENGISMQETPGRVQQQDVRLEAQFGSIYTAEVRTQRTKEVS